MCRPLRLELSPEEEVVASIHMDIIRCKLSFNFFLFISFSFLRSLSCESHLEFKILEVNHDFVFMDGDLFQR